MLLAIDVGNTNTVLGVFNKDKLEQSWRVKTDPRDTADELWLQYSALVEGFDITGVSICSTVPAVLREIRKLLDEHYQDIKTTIIEPGIKTGVPLLVDNPKEIGADRNVNSLAAFTLYGSDGPAIVVDFGTSTNLDVVSPRRHLMQIPPVKLSCILLSLPTERYWFPPSVKIILLPTRCVIRLRSQRLFIQILPGISIPTDLSWTRFPPAYKYYPL